MILHPLYRDAALILRQTSRQDLPPPMHDTRPVRWAILLDKDGNSLGDWQSLAGHGNRGERGVPMVVPFIVRTVAVAPILLADKASYVLGLRFADPKSEEARDEASDTARTLREHAAFKGLVTACAKETRDPGVEAVAKFLDRWDPQNPAGLPAGLTREHIITFQVEGRSPLESPEVRAFWAARARPESGDPPMQCLVTGSVGPAVKSSSVLIKGVPGGQSSGAALVSANADPFESYGLERAQTSPISHEASERCGKALNALLSSQSHRMYVGSLVYVWWASNGGAPLASLLGTPPDPEEVGRLLETCRTGRSWTDIDDSEFHAFALSASGGRVVIRSTLGATVRDIAKNLARWFDVTRVVGYDGQEGSPLGLHCLSEAPFREAKDIPPPVPVAIADSALGGVHLPLSLLHLTVLRCKAARRVSYPRAALIKAILCQGLSKAEAKPMERLNPLEEFAAYHCGRLLADLEEIQRAAVRGISATISDRFFGAASSAPAHVFGRLISGAQLHLAKLRKTNVGAYYAYQAGLEELMSHIDDFPKTLRLVDQARFSLGYYHQRAQKRADIAERSAAKKARDAAQADVDTTVEATQENTNDGTL